MNPSRIICVTTFRQGDPLNVVESIRTKVFFDTVRKMSEFKLTLVVVYMETEESVLQKLQDLGVVLVWQKSFGMGNIRREAFAAATDRFPNAEYICWLEPEKPNLVPWVIPMADKMESESSALGIFNRNDMASYPPEQALYYEFCRVVASQMFGFDVDYAFGPMMMSSESVSLFLDYRGEYGDKWDSILIPRLRILKSGMKLTILPIDFQNDERMTLVESANPYFILKRLEQFNNVVPSLVTEWQLLTQLWVK
jgi:hypothetical protein